MEPSNHNTIGEEKKPELSPAPSSDIPQLSIIRTEATLSRFPVHNLAKRGNVDIRIVRKTARGEIDLKWVVSPNTEYGTPRQLAYKADTILINRRIEEVGRPVPKVIRLGGLNELSKELGCNKTELKRALQQNATTAINAKIEYKDNDGSTRRLEALFTRYSIIEVGKQLPDGRKADAIYIILNEPYWEVLNNSPVRPLDYEYLKELPPVAQRFYEIVSRKIFAALKYGHPNAKLMYSEFCMYSAQQRYEDYDHFKKQMYKVHRPHLKSGYITKVEFEPSLDPEGKRDWLMLYTPGPKAQTEFDVFNGPGRAKRQVRQPRAPRMSRLLSASSDVPAESEAGGKAAAPSTAKEPVAAEATMAAVTPATPVDPVLLESLTSRGLMAGSVTTLLSTIPPERMDKVGDYVEYFDSIPPDKKGPGLLYTLIKNNDPLPASFETSRQRAGREAAERKRALLGQAKQSLQFAYDQYKDEVLDRYMTEELPKEEYDRVYQACKEQASKQGSFFGDYYRGKPELLDDIIRTTVRGEIRKTLNVLTFDEFCRREGPRILADYGIDPADLGITTRAGAGQRPTGSAAETSPEPPQGATANENPANKELPGSEPTSS